MRSLKLTIILIVLMSLLTLYYLWINKWQYKGNQEGFISMNNVPGSARRVIAPFFRNVRLYVTTTAKNIQVNAKRLRRKILE